MSDLCSLLRGSLFDRWADEDDGAILLGLVALSMTADAHKCRACESRKGRGCDIHRRLWRVRFAFYYAAAADLRRIFSADSFTFELLYADPVIHAIDAHFRGLNDGGVFRALLTYADELHDRNLEELATSALAAGLLAGGL